MTSKKVSKKSPKWHSNHPLETSKTMVFHLRSCQNQEIEGPRKNNQHGTKNAPKSTQHDTNMLSKSTPKCSQKRDWKNHEKWSPTCSQMGSQMGPKLTPKSLKIEPWASGDLQGRPRGHQDPQNLDFDDILEAFGIIFGAFGDDFETILTPN